MSAVDGPSAITCAKLNLGMVVHLLRHAFTTDGDGTVHIKVLMRAGPHLDIETVAAGWCLS